MRVMAEKYDKFESNLQSIALDKTMAGSDAVTGAAHMVYCSFVLTC